MSSGNSLSKYGMIMVASIGLGVGIGAQFSTPENRLQPIYDGVVAGGAAGVIISTLVAAYPVFVVTMHIQNAHTIVKDLVSSRSKDP